MKITALVAALLLTTVSTAYAQGGPDDRMGGPAGGGIEGPAGGGGGAPGGDPGGSGSDGGGPALRGPEGPGTGGSDAGGPGPGDAPRAAREARPEREARQPDTKSDSGDRADRPDRGTRKAAEDAGDGARKTREATEKAKTEKGDSDRPAAKESADGKDAADRKTSDEAKEAKDKAGDKETPRADTAGSAKPERAKQVELTGEKRDRIQTALRDKPEVKHRTDVHIDISIGRRLPRDWDFAPVPIAVIEIVPEYRDYVYVWVEDEYLICDPVTYEVVAVIPAGGGSRAAAASRSGGPDKCSTRIELSATERALILDSVRGREVDVADLEVGWSVPGEIQLERFPESVLAEAAELSACRYFLADDQLAIVDPDEDKVVLLIDKS